MKLGLKKETLKDLKVKTGLKVGSGPSQSGSGHPPLTTIYRADDGP